MYSWSVGTDRRMPGVGSMDKYMKKALCYLTLRKTVLDIHLIRYGVGLATALHAAETRENCVRPQWVILSYVVTRATI